MLGGHGDKNNTWLSGFTIAYVIVCDLKSCVQNSSLVGEKTLNRVTIEEFLPNIGMHPTFWHLAPVVGVK